MSDPDALAEISGKRAHVALGGALLTGYFRAHYFFIAF